jgi:hypothetical protein
MPEGVKTGGFDLVVKRARKTKRIDEKTRLHDTTAEIVGELRIEGCANKQMHIPQSGHKIRIIVCWLQDAEKGKRLYVDQWKLHTWTADEFEASRGMNYSSSDREDEAVVRSMIRHGIVTAHRHKVGLDKKLTDEQMKIALCDEDFIYTGRTGE